MALRSWTPSVVAACSPTPVTARLASACKSSSFISSTMYALISGKPRSDFSMSRWIVLLGGWSSIHALMESGGMVEPAFCLSWCDSVSIAASCAAPMAQRVA